MRSDGGMGRGGGRVIKCWSGVYRELVDVYFTPHRATPLTAFCTICVLLVLILSTYSNMLAFCLSSNWYIMVSMAM